MYTRLFIVIVMIWAMVSSCGKGNTFLEIPDGLVIDSISPNRGPVGTRFRIFGSGFSLEKNGNKVLLNGQEIDVDTLSTSRTLIATVNRQTGTGKVSVSVSGLTAEGPVFTIDQQIINPYITRLVPDSGWVNTKIRIEGGGFGNNASVVSVLFNGQAAQPLSVADKVIEVSAPDVNNNQNQNIRVEVVVSLRLSNATTFRYRNPLVPGSLTLLATLDITGRFSHAGASAGEIIMLGGGRTASGSQSLIDQYNASSGSKTTTNLRASRFDLAAASAGTRILFAGGSRAVIDNKVQVTDTVDIYDITTGQWRTDRLTQARTALAAAGNGDHIFIGGGAAVNVDGQLVASGKTERYSVITKIWDPFELSIPRYGLAAAGAQGKVVFAGGYTGSSFSAQVDIFSTVSGSVTRTNLSLPRAFLSGGTAGNKIIFAGGATANGPSDAVDIYDPDANTWTTARLSLPRYAMAVANDGDWIIFAGGLTTGNQYSNRIDIYNARTNQWTTESLPEALASMAGAAAKGRFVFGGGTNGVSNPNKLYVYTVQ